MADQQVERESPGWNPLELARARIRAWATAKDAWLRCPVQGCREKHAYADFITAHGYGIPPLPWGRVALEMLQADEVFIAWKAEQIAKAHRPARSKRAA